MVPNILVTQKHEFSVALSITPETYTESHGHVFDKETFMSISTSDEASHRVCPVAHKRSNP